jgi:hypothetical protein
MAPSDDQRTRDLVGYAQGPTDGRGHYLATSIVRRRAEICVRMERCSLGVTSSQCPVTLHPRGLLPSDRVGGSRGAPDLRGLRAAKGLSIGARPFPMLGKRQSGCRTVFGIEPSRLRALGLEFFPQNGQYRQKAFILQVFTIMNRDVRFSISKPGFDSR